MNKDEIWEAKAKMVQLYNQLPEKEKEFQEHTLGFLEHFDTQCADIFLTMIDLRFEELRERRDFYGKVALKIKDFEYQSMRVEVRSKMFQERTKHFLYASNKSKTRARG